MIKDNILKDNEIYFINYFIIKEDRDKIDHERLKSMRTYKILSTKKGVKDYTKEIVSWVCDYLEKKELVIIPFPSTNKFKGKQKQLSYQIVKMICEKNNKFINGSGFLFRKYSLHKNTRSISLQFKSLSCLKSEMITNKDVILLDDVTTTGSSLNAGIRVLKKMHPKSIKGLAIAKKVYLKDVPLTGIF